MVRPHISTSYGSGFLAAESSSECFAVQLPGGVLVRVPPRFEENELVRLLGVVRRSC